MLRFADDEGFNWDILRELRRRNPDLDVATVQERGIRQAEDSAVLEMGGERGKNPAYERHADDARVRL